MKLRSSGILGLFCFASILAMDVKIDCKDVAMSGLMDAVWFSASTAINSANDSSDDQSSQGLPGIDGEAGINCWDLDMDGISDPEEDVNGDGIWDAYDCQGAAGEDGNDAAQGAAGAPGENGTDCWDLNGDGVNDASEDINGDGVWDAQDCQGDDGEDGADGETDRVAYGVIVGTEVPEYGEPDFIPTAGAMPGIQRVYRPEPDAGQPATRGRYRIIVELPASDEDYDLGQIAVLMSVQAVRTDGGAPGSGGTTLQAFGFWEIVGLDNDADEVEIEVMVRTAPLNYYTDATFSIAVYVPTGG